jgi:uncharacterized protein (DUF2147 family)
MLKTLLATVAIVISVPGFAQMSPVGTWRSFDESTGEPKSKITIIERDGALSGKVDALLRKGVDPALRCTECTDDRKDQPVVGMEIIRGGKKAEGRELWEGGKILDPENGKEYRASYTPIDGGKKLEVRGYLGPFWRTQTWTRN